jgi:Uma2 family endonuclease
MATAALNHYTPEEYLALERNAEFKSEYLDGRIVAMTGASIAHARIAGNLFAELRQRLRGSPCSAFISDMRVQIGGGRRYTYPDVVAVCKADCGCWACSFSRRRFTCRRCRAAVV